MALQARIPQLAYQGNAATIRGMSSARVTITELYLAWICPAAAPWSGFRKGAAATGFPLACAYVLPVDLLQCHLVRDTHLGRVNLSLIEIPRRSVLVHH